MLARDRVPLHGMHDSVFPITPCAQGDHVTEVIVDCFGGTQRGSQPRIRVPARQSHLARWRHHGKLRATREWVAGENPAACESSSNTLFILLVAHAPRWFCAAHACMRGRPAPGLVRLLPLTSFNCVKLHLTLVTLQGGSSGLASSYVISILLWQEPGWRLCWHVIVFPCMECTIVFSRLPLAHGGIT